MGAAVRAVVAIVVGVILEINPATALLGSLFISYGLGQLVTALNGKANTNVPPTPWQFMANGATYPGAIIYGPTRVSGVVVFQQTSGAKNQYLWYVMAVSPWQLYDPSDDDN